MITISQSSVKGPKLGEGRYGKVFQCKTSRRLSATKFVSKEITNQESIKRELLAYQKINNECPNIAIMLGHHIDNEKSYIFLKIYDCDLRTMMSKDIIFCPFDFISDMANSLKFLKSRSIIHADIKPENILYDLEKKEFVLCDFGISVFENENKKQLVQTVEYRSPEVMSNLKYSFPIDVFSLGCIIYEILSGSFLMKSKEEYLNFISLISRLGIPSGDYYQEVYDNFLSEDPLLFKHPKKGNILIQSIKDPYLDDIVFGEIIRGCIELNPNDRITPEQILNMLGD